MRKAETANNRIHSGHQTLSHSFFQAKSEFLAPDIGGKGRKYMKGKIITVMVAAVLAALLTACSSKEPPEHPGDSAIKQLEEKAQLGDADAQNKLGGLYYTGDGVTQDFKKAAYWAQQAAEQGRPDAQANLAIMYYKGEGVTQDYKQAYVWWSLAVAQADLSIGSDIERVAEKLSPRELSEARELTAEIQNRIDSPSRPK
jgi:predicted small lipoprotein YifL